MNRRFKLTIIGHDGLESHYLTKDQPKIIPDERLIQFRELIEPEIPEDPPRVRCWLFPITSLRAAFFEEVEA